jgi:hypothetical protein
MNEFIQREGNITNPILNVEKGIEGKRRVGQIIVQNFSVGYRTYLTGALTFWQCCGTGFGGSKSVIPNYRSGFGSGFGFSLYSKKFQKKIQNRIS